MTIIENYDPIPLSRAVQSFGINMGSLMATEWAYQEAAKAGCTKVRFQVSWSQVEDFDNPGTFDFSGMDTALALCKKYGLRPMVVAAYAPPWRTIQTVTLSDAAPIGSTSVFVDEDISGLQPGRDHIGGLWYQVGFGKPAYYGGIIHAIDGQEIRLGAPTVGAFADGAQVAINRLLYPSVDQLVGSLSAQRYADYVVAMAEKIASYGIEGRVEIWNEPPWANDRWDQRSGFYADPAGMGIETWLYMSQPLAQVLRTRPMPEGVGLVSGATHKSGGHGLLRHMTPEQVATSAYVSEATHPYGANAEINWWWITGDGLDWGDGYVNLVGNSNFTFNKKLIDENPEAGLDYIITECGVYTSDNEVKRNYDLRHFVSAMAMGFTEVIFYSFGDTPNLRMWDPIAQTPIDSWLDLKRLMMFLNLVNRNQGNYELPVISSWEGTEWNLAVCEIGPILVVWQRTVVPSGAGLWPATARLILEEGSGTLLQVGLNERTHQSSRELVVEVGSKPILLTRKVS